MYKHVKQHNTQAQDNPGIHRNAQQNNIQFFKFAHSVEALIFAVIFEANKFWAVSGFHILGHMLHVEIAGYCTYRKTRSL